MKLFKFENGIYPRTLWVTKDADVSKLNKFFCFHDGDLITHGDLDDSCASTYDVFDSRSGKFGILVILSNPEEGTIAHEAVHVADYIFAELGCLTQTFENRNEPYAYLVGWAAKCMHQVWD